MKEELRQVLCVGIPGEGLTPGFHYFFKEYQPGNFILFRRNTGEGPRALKELTRGLRDLTRKTYMPEPFICVDQEGGRVARLMQPHWPRLPSFEDIGKGPHPEEIITEIGERCGQMLRDMGINVNLAPCLDLMEEGADPVMRQRTLSHDPTQVAELGARYIEAMARYGVGAVAKHFPGIGGIDKDPHLDFSLSRCPMNRQHEALQPFKRAVRTGVLGIMTSHVLFPMYDPENIATFSKGIISMLRDEVGLGSRIVFTDDLFMGAIQRHYGLGDAGALALKAGHDVLLYCHGLDETASAIESLIRYAESDDKLRECVNKSYQRIIDQKKKFWEKP